MAPKSYPRVLPAPETSFFLFGARGMGKSTWASSAYPDAYSIDLLDEHRYEELLVDPGSLGDELRPLRRGSWVVLDEVQRVPPLLNEVHRAIERQGLKFALLGSSSRKLKTTGTNLLAGRAVQRELHPFVPEELGQDFDLNAVLRFGSIPLIWMSDDKRGALDAYVRLYLREEIRSEALVRNLAGFLRFLPIAALFHGQVINLAGIARDSGTPRMTVAGYVEVLEDTLVATRLPAYEARLRVRERKHPKLYWTDPGLVRAVKRQLGEVGAEEVGALLEGWVLTLIRAYGQTRQLYDEISYWAPAQGKTEVDFVLRRGKELLAIEVKAQNRFSSVLTKGLRAMEDLRGVKRRILVYRGRRALLTEDGVDVWPVERFIRSLETDDLWP